MTDTVEVFVTDLDHTLLHPETEDLPDRLPDMLDTWMNSGNIWVIATGRQQTYLEDVMNELRILPDYYITRSRYIHPGRQHNHPAFDEWNETVEQLTIKQKKYTQEWIPKVEEWAAKNSLNVETHEGYVMFDSAEDGERAFHFVSDVIDDDFKVLRNREFLIVVPHQTGKGNCLKYLCKVMGCGSPRFSAWGTV